MMRMSLKEARGTSCDLQTKESHATFLVLDITIREGIFVYKLFDKCSDSPSLFYHAQTRSAW